MKWNKFKIYKEVILQTYCKIQSLTRSIQKYMIWCRHSKKRNNQIKWKCCWKRKKTWKAAIDTNKKEIVITLSNHLIKPTWKHHISATANKISCRLSRNRNASTWVARLIITLMKGIKARSGCNQIDSMLKIN